MIRGFFALVLLLVLNATNAATTSKFAFGRFGETVVYKSESVRHAALYFSGMQGWSAADDTLAQSLSDHGVLVVGIDLRHYSAALSKPRDKCSYLAGEFEDLSHELQKHFSPERYHLPVLIGVGEGASLVYAVAAQGSSGTFAGTLTLEFRSRWKPPLKLCQSYELRYAVGSDGITALKPSPNLSTPWIALHAAGDRQFPSSELRNFVAAVGTAKAVIVPTDDIHVDHVAVWQNDVVTNVARLAEVDRDRTIYSDELRDLPLEEVRSQSTPTTTMALFLTGDGGWAAIDKGVSGQLAARGIDVVALSSLQYFWKPRSPDEAAKDVARVLRHYLAAWDKRSVLVVGYSFGADISAFVINKLPDDLRSRVIGVGMLGLSATADFEVHVSTWLGVDHHGSPPTLPEVERLSMPVLCVYGEGETDSACPQLKKPNITTAKVGNGHHFGDRYQELADKISRLGASMSN